MEQGNLSLRARAWNGVRVAAVALAALLLLALGARQAPATHALPEGGVPGTDYELGNFCVRDYVPGADCTAEDVKIASLSAIVEEPCTAVGDTALVRFRASVQTNSTERYDIGFFVGLGGGSARDGDLCYHDFLHPASSPGPWNLTGGYGPFKEIEVAQNKPRPDACGDTRNADGLVAYLFQAPVQITCTDANNDGVLDQTNWSTCTTWDNVSSYNCVSVKDAYPSTTAKCKCENAVLADPILLYRGYDWADLPNGYGTLAADNGPSHAVQDSDNDGMPNTQGGEPAVWLGQRVDFSPAAETDGQPSPAATGDDDHWQNGTPVDDEDGISATGAWVPGPNGGEIQVRVNSSGATCSGCRLGFWIDWNGDGDFADAGESYTKPVAFGTQTLKFDIPADALLGMIYARFRLYAGAHAGEISPKGHVLNGEVEDYYWVAPTAVELVWFEATGTDAAVVLAWETATEIDNLGFNLYRATSVDGPRTQVNAGLIPTQVPPGSPFGAVYEYLDEDVTPGTAYFYWLQDVDVYGRTGLHGPASAQVGPRMHVEGIKLAHRVILPGWYSLAASIRVVDVQAQPLAGASVRVEWTRPDGTVAVRQALTDARGTAKVGLRASAAGTYSLCVVALDKSEWVYDPAQNRVTCTSLTLP